MIQVTRNQGGNGTVTADIDYVSMTIHYTSPADVCRDTFTVTAVAGASGYTWTLPPGAVITSGANTNSIGVDFSATTPGCYNVCVTADNACGSTAQSCTPIEVSICNPLSVNVGDYVWEDTDEDGVQDGGESGIEGVTVYLYESDGTPVDTMTTASDGSYLFTGVDAGDYYVVFDVSTNTAGNVYLGTTQDAGGDDALDSDANASTGQTAVFTVSGSDILTIDAGFYLCVGASSGITVEAGPTVKVCAGETITIGGVADPNVVSYQWSTSGGDIAGATSNTYTFIETNPGNQYYYVIGYNAAGCWSVDSVLVINIECGEICNNGLDDDGDGLVDCDDDDCNFVPGCLPPGLHTDPSIVAQTYDRWIFADEIDLNFNDGLTYCGIWDNSGRNLYRTGKLYLIHRSKWRADVLL